MNVVDSCGWLEYFANGPNADFFAPVIEDVEQLLVPAIAVFEVSRRLLHTSTQAIAEAAVEHMGKARIVHLDAQGMFNASQAAIAYRLALADAIIWQTAQTNAARLYTQDVDLRGLPGVHYQAKTLQAKTLLAKTGPAA